MTNDEPKPCFTVDQYNQLTDEEKHALHKVAHYLTPDGFETDDDQTLSETFNILRPCKGCLPEEEIGDHLLLDIHRKFACVYYSAVKLTEEKLTELGFHHSDDFGFCLEIEPRYEDTTHVAVVDFRQDERPFCYFHHYRKAWHFSFTNLQEIAEEVLRTQNAIIETVLRLQQLFKERPDAKGGTPSE